VHAYTEPDMSGTTRYHPAGPHKETTELRAVLIELIGAIDGRVGDDTVDESLRYRFAMERARELAEKPARTVG
jgi:hypothetical protein